MLKVEHWRYDDGWHSIPTVLQKFYGGQTTEYREELVGWHCWVYAGDVDIEKWMKDRMSGKYSCVFRFNSGDPMHTVHITDDEDAVQFKLTWL